MTYVTLEMTFPIGELWFAVRGKTIVPNPAFASIKFKQIFNESESQNVALWLRFEIPMRRTNLLKQNYRRIRLVVNEKDVIPKLSSNS